MKASNPTDAQKHYFALLDLRRTVKDIADGKRPARRINAKKEKTKINDRD